ncbi:GSCOCG00008635001-RA-CDS [Cotesia congregata]|nr:GSCOCG00008635001-RA-CDS [Cotesia congregata]
MSLDEFPALGASRGISKSNSLTLRNTQSSTNLQGFVREGSVDSTRSLRFPSDLNSPLNSPFYQNKNFFGSSSSSLTSTSGLGASYHSATSGSFSSLSTGRNSPGMGRGRKFSDASLVPHTPVAVSDMTCKDDTSPAEQCFNYFTFSLFWPPALGYEYQTKNKPVNDNINTLKWSIHALWPSSHSGIVPENCHKRTSVTFNQYRFEREKGLRASLENKWVTICPYKWTGSSAVSFWDREFSKHGACAARSLLIGSDVGYFKMANSLFDNVGITNVLLNIGFEVGTQMSYGDLVEKVNEKLGKRARIEFISDKINNNKHYLKEIKVCYDLQFHRINCPGTGLISTDVRSKEITYLDHVPTLQSTISI